MVNQSHVLNGILILMMVVIVVHYSQLRSKFFTQREVFSMNVRHLKSEIEIMKHLKDQKYSDYRLMENNSRQCFEKLMATQVKQEECEMRIRSDKLSYQVKMEAITILENEKKELYKENSRRFRQMKDLEHELQIEKESIAVLEGIVEELNPCLENLLKNENTSNEQSNKLNEKGEVNGEKEEVANNVDDIKEGVIDEILAGENNQGYEEIKEKDENEDPTLLDVLLPIDSDPRKESSSLDKQNDPDKVDSMIDDVIKNQEESLGDDNLEKLTTVEDYNKDPVLNYVKTTRLEDEKIKSKYINEDYGDDNVFELLPDAEQNVI